MRKVRDRKRSKGIIYGLWAIKNDPPACGRIHELTKDGHKSARTTRSTRRKVLEVDDYRRGGGRRDSAGWKTDQNCDIEEDDEEKTSGESSSRFVAIVRGFREVYGTIHGTHSSVIFPYGTNVPFSSLSKGIVHLGMN